MKDAAIKKGKLEHKLKTLERSLAQAQKTEIIEIAKQHVDHGGRQPCAGDQRTDPYHTAWTAIKEETSTVSAASKQLLTDLRKTCARKEIESARLEHENLVAQVEKDNAPLTDCNVKVDLHSMEELEKQEANLEMDRDTNSNPEKCKADIAKHEKTNEGMQRRADKVERDGCVTTTGSQRCSRSSPASEFLPRALFRPSDSATRTF
ncbi:hypothetical protein C8R44DRAFT_984168 [Mycena epipterygia]|nr:hypothetical protein C8R44DRAFT_984168 [Mycena epipterygia]